MLLKKSIHSRHTATGVSKNNNLVRIPLFSILTDEILNMDIISKNGVRKYSTFIPEYKFNMEIQINNKLAAYGEGNPE